MNGSGIGTEEAVQVITTAHLVLIAILAIIVLIAIWWGVTLRRRRRQAEEEAREKDLVRPAPPTASVAPPVKPPVTPAPPPLAQAPAAAISDAIAPMPVTMLKGLGPKVAARLGELGISDVVELARLSPAEAEALDAELGPFRGRMARDRWLEQARLLASGDRAGYEATFGKIG